MKSVNQHVNTTVMQKPHRLLRSSPQGLSVLTPAGNGQAHRAKTRASCEVKDRHVGLQFFGTVVAPLNRQQSVQPPCVLQPRYVEIIKPQGPRSRLAPPPQTTRHCRTAKHDPLPFRFLAVAFHRNPFGANVGIFVCVSNAAHPSLSPASR